jgi:hypothetical protein
MKAICHTGNMNVVGNVSQILNVGMNVFGHKKRPPC